MSLLEWREGTSADRPALQAFECTTPGHKMKQRPWHELHPKRWELALQREIHTLSPRSSARRTVQLGFDDQGLAAVAVAENEENSRVAMLECVGIALRQRGQGGACADEAIERVMDWAVDRAFAEGADRLLLIAKSHKSNTAAQALMQRHNFGLHARASGRNEFDQWNQQFVLYAD